MTKYIHSIQILCLLTLFVALVGCSIKKTVYFNDLQIDSTYTLRKSIEYEEPKIKVDDILQISIQTIDPTTSAIVNQSLHTQAVGASSATNIGSQVISGFLVDKAGEINLTMIGKLSVVGLTTYEVREKINELAQKYYKSPTVQVRFANFKITVLGEVMKPASYIIPNEKVSVLDALGLAGDMTIYGKRENVLLIREIGGLKELVRLNLNDSKLFQSPYFYLRQNDVLYVEPGRAKAAANNAARTQTYALIGSFLSIMMVVASRFYK